MGPNMLPLEVRNWRLEHENDKGSKDASNMEIPNIKNELSQ